MRIIEIHALGNGAHRNQNGPDVCPEGWAVIPDEMEIPASFPYVGIKTDESTPPVVTEMTAGTVPEPEPEQEEPSQLDRVAAQVMYTALMTDTLLEV